MYLIVAIMPGLRLQATLLIILSTHPTSVVSKNWRSGRGDLQGVSPTRKFWCGSSRTEVPKHVSQSPSRYPRLADLIPIDSHINGAAPYLIASPF